MILKAEPIQEAGNIGEEFCYSIHSGPGWGQPFGFPWAWLIREKKDHNPVTAHGYEVSLSWARARAAKAVEVELASRVEKCPSCGQEVKG